MRYVLFVAWLVSAVPAFSQANEITIQFGKVVGEGRRFSVDALPGQFIPEEAGLAGGIVYNRRIVGGRAASLHFHLPFFAFENTSSAANLPDNPLGDTSSLTGFTTPGLQLRLLDSFPLQPYAFAGVGYAYVARIAPDEGLRSLTVDHEGTWGVSAGGGLSVMFNSNFGLRGEIRSLTTGAASRIVPGLTLDDPGTRWAATGGLVFRF